uniref:Uncharacterized protein n=2 Tax=Strongyloides stercoralis TaxID=6248 RepID=A0A0K0DZE6_STRER
MKHLKDTPINNTNENVKVFSKKEKIDDNNSLLSSFSSSFSSSISFTRNTVKEIFKKEKYTSISKHFSIKRNKRKKKPSLTPEDFFKDDILEGNMLDSYFSKKKKQSKMFNSIKLSNIFKNCKLSNCQKNKIITKEEKHLKFMEDSKVIGKKMLDRKNNINKINKKSYDIEKFDEVSIEKSTSPPETPRSRYKVEKFVYKNNSVKFEDAPFLKSCGYDMQASIRRKSLYIKSKNTRFGRSMSTKNYVPMSTIYEDYEQVIMRDPISSSDEDDSDSDYYDDYVELGGSQIHYFDML